MSYHQRMLEVCRDHARMAIRKNKAKPRAWGEVIEVCVNTGLPAPFSAFSSFLEVHMSLVTKAFGGSSDPESDWGAEDPTFAENHPIVHAFLASREMIGGKRRQGATLTIVAEDSVWKAGLRDRDKQASLWVSATSVAGVFDALETALGKTPVEWRKAPENQLRNRKGP